MALKLNIRPQIEEEMEALLPRVAVRSKTEYINNAIDDYNQKIKRNLYLSGLKKYFHDYQKEGRSILSEFANLPKFPD